jgi:hypothetical protein
MLTTLTKALVWVALIGLIGFDTFSIASVQYVVRSDAQDAAQVGHQELAATHNAKKAYAAVVRYAEEHGDEVLARGFATGDQDEVTVELRRQARTLIAGHLPAVSGWTVATSVSSARSEIG